MKTLISSIFFFTSIFSYSQEKIEVLDADFEAPIIAAQVVFYVASQNDSTVLLTNEKGIVFCPAFSDSIRIKIKAIGYTTYFGYIYSDLNTKIALEEKKLNLETVVITGQYSPNTKSNSIYTITVIDQNQLEEKGTTNMQELLNSQLSFKTNNGHTNETALNINGLSGSHVKFMIDGVPVEGRVNGNVDLSQINMDEIQRVEIIEGPVSVVYGTNALGGVVNLITKKYTKKRVEGYVNSYYETVGKYNFSGGIGLKKGSNSLKLSGGRHFFSGYADNDTSRAFIWKPREQYFGNIQLGHRFKKYNLSISANGFSETMQSKGELQVPYYITAFDTYNKTERFTNRYLFNGAINKKSYLDLTFAYSYYKRKRNIFFKDLSTLDSFLTDGESDQDTTIYNNLIFRGFYSNKLKKEKFSYLVGTEFKQDFVSANRIQNGVQTMGNYAFYGSLNYRLFKRITIQPAIRYAYNTRYTAPLIPSIIAEVELKNMKIKGSYARGFRTPNLKELYLEFHFNETINLWGNENLKPENSNHYLLSFEVKKKKFKLISKIFYTRINGLIDLVRMSDVDWEYDNVGHFISKGTSISITYATKSLLANLGYTYLGTYDAQFIDKKPVVGFENQFQYSSNIMANIKYTVKKWNIGATANYKYIGQTNSFYLTEEGNIENSYIGQYSILDMTLFKHFWDKKITLVGGVKNILNTTEVDLTGNVYGFSTSKNANSMSVLWGRTGFVSIKIRV